MDSGDMLFNRDRAVSELLSVKRDGMGQVVRMLDESTYFSASTGRSDPGEGSLANQRLWQLRLAKDTLSYAISRNGNVPETMEESLILLCFLHGLEDCRLKLEQVLKRSGLELRSSEKQVLSSDSPLQGGSIDSKDEAALLSYIFHGAMKNAADYAAGIPFSTEAASCPLPKPRIESSSVWLDEEDHRLWCDVLLPSFKPLQHADFELYEEVGTSCVLPISLTGEKGCDCAVICDESGMMAFVAKYNEEEDGSFMMNSDRICFGYSDLTLFFSKYPKYRPSYVLALRADGKWGAFSVKLNSKKRTPLVDVVPLVRHEFRNKEAAIRAIKTRAGYPARVRHHLFYQEVSVMDAFLSE